MKENTDIDEFSSFNIDEIVTPINPDVLLELLTEVKYDEEKTSKIIDGFRHGFDIGYEGHTQRVNESKNLPFHVGDQYDMWGKIMKEVKLKRYGGPFKREEIPYQY